MMWSIKDLDTQRRREKAVARESKRTGYAEGIRFDHEDKKAYVIRVSFYPKTKWFAQEHTWLAPHRPVRVKANELTPELWARLEPLRL